MRKAGFFSGGPAYGCGDCPPLLHTRWGLSSSGAGGEALDIELYVAGSSLSAIGRVLGWGTAEPLLASGGVRHTQQSETCIVAPDTANFHMR